MGRYYNGDIEGKFWVAVQSSDDGEFFGAEEQSTSVITYYTEDLERCEAGIKECHEALGENLTLLDEFFKNEPGGYNNTMILEQTGIEDPQEALQWYARLELGKKILQALKKNGYCSFSAEI